MNTVEWYHVVAFVVLLTLVLPWLFPILHSKTNPLKRYAHWVWDFMERKGWGE